VNPERVEGTYLLERNFGKLRVEGPRGKRRLVLEAYDTRGTLKWSKAIERSELSFPKPIEPKPAK
jgi:alkaline phosphatase D